MGHLCSHKAMETAITAAGTALSGLTSMVRLFIITTPTTSHSHKPLLLSFVCDAVTTCKSKVHAALQYLSCTTYNTMYPLSHQVNSSNYDQFKCWAASYPQVKLLNDGSTCNDNRLGAVACIELAISTFNITDDLIVIGG